VPFGFLCLTHNSVFPILSREPLLDSIPCSNESELGVSPVRSSREGKRSKTEGNRLPMPDPAQKKATYEDLYHLPDGVVGEILNGQLVATPRPSPRHARVSSALGITLGGPFMMGKGGGPGGWWILDEPEVKLGENILVPDLAGWRKERLPDIPEQDNWISVSPDWVCEVLSPATVRTDRVLKMPIYAKFEVASAWLIDPASKTLEVFQLESGKWVLLAAHSESDKARIEPFQEVELDLSLLWG